MTTSRREEEIWDTAERLFSEQGYHATTMRQIASQLGLEGGSLYAHIESKQQILSAVVTRIGDKFLEAMEGVATTDIPPEEKLRMAVRTHIRLIAENLDAATVYFHEWRFLEDEHREAVLARRDTYEGYFRGIVAQGMEAGAFRGASSKFASILVLSAGNWLYQWYAPEGPLSPEEIADRFTDMILEGLQAPERAWVTAGVGGDGELDAAKGLSNLG